MSVEAGWLVVQTDSGLHFVASLAARAARPVALLAALLQKICVVEAKPGEAAVTHGRDDGRALSLSAGTAPTLAAGLATGRVLERDVHGAFLQLGAPEGFDGGFSGLHLQLYERGPAPRHEPERTHLPEGAKELAEVIVSDVR